MGTTSHTSTGWIARGYDSRVIVTWILIWALAFGPAAVHHHRCVGVGDSPPDLLASLRKMHCDAPLLPASGGMKARLLDEPGAEGAGDRWIVRYDKTALLKDSSIELLLMLQPHQPSVQGLVETVLSRKLQQSIRIVGASRTDTGVHARGQMVHFDCVKADMTQEETAKFVHQLNLKLTP